MKHMYLVWNSRVEKHDKSQVGSNTTRLLINFVTSYFLYANICTVDSLHIKDIPRRNLLKTSQKSTQIALLLLPVVSKLFNSVLLHNMIFLNSRSYLQEQRLLHIFKTVLLQNVMKFLGSDGSAFEENAEWQISDDLRKFFSFLKTSLQNQIFSKFPQNLQTFF